MFSRFPFSECLELNGHHFAVDDVIQYLGEMIYDQRKEKIQNVLESRTYSVTVVMENIYDRGNVSAVMRSAEAMGYQSVHLIQESEEFKTSNRVTQGADKWLDVNVWTSKMACISDLKSKGYKIYATALENSVPLTEVDWSEPSAIVLGNEKEGISSEMRNASDECVLLPMQGFVQSYNISVAAALFLYHIYLKRIEKLGCHGDLSENEKKILTAVYYIRSYPSSFEVLCELRKKGFMKNCW